MIEIAAYDPEWAREFAEISAVLAHRLGPLADRIEHVGSTAVPGLAAKPILDIDIVIDLQTDLTETIVALHELGYRHRGDQGIEGREAFKRTGNDVPRGDSRREWQQHHLYVCSKDSRELARHLAFRNYLRLHTDRAVAYGELKQRLAVQFAASREEYNDAKTDFVISVLRQAAPDLV